MTGSYEEIDGFRCYAPRLALDCADYPSDGFDVTAEVEERSFWCRSRNRLIRQLLDRYTDRSRPLELLEIGCGIGGVLKALRDIPNLRLTGSEIYLQGLRYARAKMSDVTFIQLDASDIPFRDAFDIIGAFDVLEHIEADEQVIRHLAHALRPDGLLLVTVPQYPWMWSDLDEIVRHKRRYRRRELLDKLTDGGFDVLYSSSFVAALFPFMALARLRSRNAARSEDTKAAFASHVVLPGSLNRAFDWIMRIDETAIRAGMSLPFGGSLVAVARRRATTV